MGARVRARARHRASRHQAGQHPHRARQRARDGHRLRHRATDRQRRDEQAAHARGTVDRHGGVHEPGAGSRRAGGRTQRSVRTRRRGFFRTHRARAVRGRPRSRRSSSRGSRRPRRRSRRRGPDVPSALASAIDRCLAREPNDRFPSAEALAEALSEGRGLAGAPDIAPPVRSFLRAAEQTVWLGSLIVVFSADLRTADAPRRRPCSAPSCSASSSSRSIWCVARASCISEGFGAADVRRGFELERVAHAEEMRQLFDARRTAKWRRTRRRAWMTLAVGVVLRVAVQYAFMRLGRNAPMVPAWIVAMILLDIVNTVSFVVGVSASPRSERRAFGLAAWIWRSRFATAFFRVAALGRGRSAAQRSKDRAARRAAPRGPRAGERRGALSRSSRHAAHGGAGACRAARARGGDHARARRRGWRAATGGGARRLAGDGRRRRRARTVARASTRCATGAMRCSARCATHWRRHGRGARR